MLISWIQNHKRDTGAALGGIAAAMKCIGEIWAIDAPWYGKTVATVMYAAGFFSAIGFGHAYMKQKDGQAE